MSPTAARLAALAIGLLAFAGRLAATFWVQPLSWDIEPAGLRLATTLTAYALSIGVPFLGYMLVISPLRRRPASLRVDGDRNRFVAPASPTYPGTQAILMMWLAGGVILAERDGDRMRLAELPEAASVAVVGVAFFLALAMAFLLVNRPYVALDPAGLIVQRLRRRSRISWDDLALGGPPPPVKRNPRYIRLYLRDRQLHGGFPASEDLPVGWLHVDPSFLTALIRDYVHQPEHRAAIGTEAELTRLRSAFVEQPIAPSHQPA